MPSFEEIHSIQAFACSSPVSLIGISGKVDTFPMPLSHVPRPSIFFKTTRLLAFVVFGFLSFVGCSLGPRTLMHSRLRYNDAVKTTSEEQLLLRLIGNKFWVDFFECDAFNRRSGHFAHTSLSNTKDIGITSMNATETPSRRLPC